MNINHYLEQLKPEHHNEFLELAGLREMGLVDPTHEEDIEYKVDQAFETVRERHGYTGNTEELIVLTKEVEEAEEL
jgi:hypothetical protein